MHGIISREVYAQHSFTNKSFVKEKNHIQSKLKKPYFREYFLKEKKQQRVTTPTPRIIFETF